MRLKHFFIYTLLSTLTWAVAGGCRKDVEEFRPYPNTLGDIALLLGKVPDASTRTVFMMSGAFADTTLRTASGVRILLSDSEALFEDAQGTPVPCSTCQALEIEVTEALKKGDLLARGLQTSDEQQHMFETAGAVLMNFVCDGKKLRIQKSRHIKVQIPATDPQGDWSLLTHPEQDSTIWKNTGDAAYMADWLIPGGAVVQGYELLVKDPGWASAGKYLKTDSGGSLCIDLPPNLNPQNTVVFLVFKKTRTVIQLDSSVTIDDFCSLQLPPGEPVRIVTVSKFGETFWAGTLEDETGFNASVKSLAPIARSEQDIIDLLRGL